MYPDSVRGNAEIFPVAFRGSKTFNKDHAGQDRLAGHPEASVAAEQQLLTDAVNLMGLGLSTVFVFLTLLVGVTSLMSILVNRLAPSKVIATAQAQAAPIEPTSDESLLAVIAAAIHAHRARR